MGKKESLPVLGSWDQKKKELDKIKNYFANEIRQKS